MDTRAITRKLRNHGVMMGLSDYHQNPQRRRWKHLKRLPDYGSIDFVKDITTDKPYQWGLALQDLLSSKINVKTAVRMYPIYAE